MIIEVPYTLEQIRAATKAQIITFITNKLDNFSKKQIIVWLFENVIEIADKPTTVVRPDGQLTSQSEIIRDVETGALVTTKTITWTYYATGEVDTITIVVTNSVGTEMSRTVIKHYKDGRQPKIE